MIPKYKTILYTTDMAPNSLPVFRHALGVAQRYDAKVYILHVVEEMDPSHQNYLSALIGEETYKKRAEKLKQEVVDTLKERLKAFAEEQLNGHPEQLEAVAGIEVVHGYAVAQILKMAEEVKADMLVFGTHGQGIFDQNLLGSVVHRVLRRTQWPVLVVPVVEESEKG